MEPEGSLPHSQQPSTCPYPEPDQSSPCPPSYCLKIHFNIILPSTPGSSKWSPSLRSPRQNPVCTSPLPHTCYMPRLHYRSLSSSLCPYLTSCPHKTLTRHSITCAVDAVTITLPARALLPFDNTRPSRHTLCSRCSVWQHRAAKAHTQGVPLDNTRPPRHTLCSRCSIWQLQAAKPPTQGVPLD
jgi:hypothetical protein